VAYLRPARHRSNLLVRTRAHAARIIFAAGRATGVEYRDGNRLVTASARREVILSAGVFGSPQLLQLSGIGPANALRPAGVEVVRDMPAVGANLQEHLSTYCVFRIARPLTVNDLALSWWRKLLAGIEYVALRSGPLANNALCVGAFVRADPASARPDLQINMSTFAALERTRNSIKPYPFSAITLSPVHLRPEGRGTVAIRSADPLTPPAVHFNFAVSDADLQTLLFGIRLCRRIASQPALAAYGAEEVAPGAAVRDDQALVADLRRRAIGNMHPVGTCRMGSDAGAVVDPRLRVQGIAGLRVADASVMPLIVSGNTNAPTIMIGEKAAAMILEDAA
jgi:choline dehydrogenase